MIQDIMNKIISIFCIFFYVNVASAVVYTERPYGFTPVVEVSACFLEQNGKFLFLHRQDNKSHGNTWAIPGGKVEKKESSLHAIVREMKEETGIILPPESVTFIKTVYITHTGSSGVSFIYHIFSASYDGTLAISIDPSEHKGFTWVTLQDALRMELMDDEAPCIELAYPATVLP